MFRNSANRVILVGHLGKEPEIKHLQNDRKVASLTLATNTTWRDKSGSFQERVEWFRLVAWGNLAEYCAKLPKGQQVFVEGSLRIRDWTDKEGVKHYITEINVDTLTPLGKKKSSGEPAAGAEAGPDDKAGDDVPF